MDEPAIANSRSIIVVDDDASVRDSLKVLLELEGFAVSVYAAGTELLERDKLSGCSCFVIDQEMPGIKGLDLAAQLRNRSIVTPVVLVTSRCSPTVIARAADAGIPIVEKPFLGNDLLETIRALVEKIHRP